MTRLSETILPNNILTDSNTQTVTNKTLVGSTNVLGVNVDTSSATFALPTASDALLGQTTYQQESGLAVLNAGTASGLRGLGSEKELIYAESNTYAYVPTSWDFPTLLEDLRVKFNFLDFDAVEIEIRCVPYYNEGIIPAIQFYDTSSTLLTTDYDTQIATQMLYGPSPSGYIGNTLASNLDYMRLTQFDATNTDATSFFPYRQPFEVKTNIILQGLRRRGDSDPNRLHFVSAVTSSGYSTQVGSTQVGTALCRVVNSQTNRVGGFKFSNAFGTYGTNRFRAPAIRVFVHRSGSTFYSTYTTTGL
jgi:hypothetical protein